MKRYRIYQQRSDFIARDSGKPSAKDSIFTALEEDFTGKTREVQEEFGLSYTESEVILKGYWVTYGYRWVYKSVPYLFFFRKLTTVEEPYRKNVKGTRVVWVRKDLLVTLSDPYIKGESNEKV